MDYTGDACVVERWDHSRPAHLKGSGSRSSVDLSELDGVPQARADRLTITPRGRHKPAARNSADLSLRLPWKVLPVLHLLAPVADYDAKLPALETHQHAPKLVPRYFLAVDN